MKKSEEYIDSCYNRDLSWLLFNRRVIDLATESRTPFLNKINFLGISANNLDEFYSVRVPSLQSQMHLTNDGIEKKSGLRYSEIIRMIHAGNEKNYQIQYRDYDHLMNELRDRKICSISKYDSLNGTQRKQVRDYFEKQILPFIEIETFDSQFNLNFIQNKESAVAVSVENGGKQSIEVLTLPQGFERLIKVDDVKFDTFVLLDDVLIHNLKSVIADKKIVNSFAFRITRDLDADLEVEKEDNNVETIERMRQYLVDREKGKVTRFEVECFDDEAKSFLDQFVNRFGINENALFNLDGPIDLTFLFDIFSRYSVDYFNLCYPRFNAIEWNKQNSMLSYLKQKDLLIQYPYDSFSQFLEFLKEAVESTDTVAIKQTLYRVSKHSEVVSLLEEAARNGIKTTVVVELRARFDEKNNLKVTEELKEAGCHIIFGKKNMKVHSKTCLVLTKEGENPEGYVQVGTGNYNMQTAKGFVDLSFFTSKNDYVKDLSKFFDYLQNPDASQPKYDVLSASPHQIQDEVIDGIADVKESYLKTGKGSVFLKVNSLTDVEVISAIYDAARVGVPFRLVVRGACCLKLGVCGKKEKIVVSSVVGEFLEHSRIYGFFTSEDTKLWISSADLMTRNMDNRVELAAPIIAPILKKQLLNIINIYAQDDVDGSFLKKNGNYFKYRHPKGKSAQQTFLKMINKPRLVNKTHISKRHNLRINLTNISIMERVMVFLVPGVLILAGVILILMYL